MFTSIIPAHVGIQDGGKETTVPLTGLSVHLIALTVSWYKENANHIYNFEFNLPAYYFEPSLDPVTDSLPLPHFSLQFCYSRETDALDLIQNFLLNIPLSHVTYMSIGWIPLVGQRTEIMTERVLGDYLSFLFKMSPLQTMCLAGDCVSALSHLINCLATKETYAKYGLFGSLRSLIVGRVDDSLWGRDAFQEEMRALCDTISKQSHLFRGMCIPFSTLVLQSWRVPYEWSLELVDSVAGILHQQGRFTHDLPMIRTHNPQTSDAPYPPPVAENPDADLDGPLTISPESRRQKEGDWTYHVAHGRVTLI